MASYALYLAVCAVIAMVLLFIRTRDGLFAATALLCGLALGIIGAKLGYLLIQCHFVAVDGLRYSLTNRSPAMWCFTTGCAGAAGGVALAAKFREIRVLPALNSFACVGALMIAAARLGFLLLQDSMTGWGTWLEQPLPFPLAVSNEWGEYYLAPFMLEALCAAVIALMARCVWHEGCFIRTVFWLCLCQVFCESLHSDSLSSLFVRAEQLLCLLGAAGILTALGLLRPGKRTFAPLILCLVCAGVIVAVEFALQKSTVPVPVLYGVMLAALTAMGVAECRLRRHTTKERI